MEILERINELRKARGWSIYKLSEESGISQSTLSNMFVRETNPNITTLKQLCEAFGITLSQFFDYESNDFSDEESFIIANYRKLSDNEKLIVKNLLETIIKSK